jgi:hypothetical protein
MRLIVTKQDTLSCRRVDNVLASAAYQAAARLIDWSTGDVHDYQARHRALAHTGVLVPERLGFLADDREALWNNVARNAHRSRAWPAYRVSLGVSAVLTIVAQIKLVRSFAREHFVEREQGADVALDQRDPMRPVARILTSCRSLPAGAAGRRHLLLDNATFRCWQEDWGRRCARARYEDLMEQEAARRPRALLRAS